MATAGPAGDLWSRVAWKLSRGQPIAWRIKPNLTRQRMFHWAALRGYNQLALRVRLRVYIGTLYSSTRILAIPATDCVRIIDRRTLLCPGSPDSVRAGGALQLHADA